MFFWAFQDCKKSILTFQKSWSGRPLRGPRLAARLPLLSKLLKIDENDQNAFVNIFQWTIDMIIIGFVGCYILLKPLLTQISWLQTEYYDPYGFYSTVCSFFFAFLNARKMLFSWKFACFWPKTCKFFVLLPDYFLRVVHWRELVRLKDWSLKNISSAHMMGLEPVEKF